MLCAATVKFPSFNLFGATNSTINTMHTIVKYSDIMVYVKLLWFDFLFIIKVLLSLKFLVNWKSGFIASVH